MYKGLKTFAMSIVKFETGDLSSRIPGNKSYVLKITTGHFAPLLVAALIAYLRPGESAAILPFPIPLFV